MQDQAFGKYIIKEHLGSGAFADVYKAHDPGLDRFVALKLLKPLLASDQTTLDRFMNEARSLARLEHPNIAWVHDIGQQEGRYYIAIRYIDGPSLEAILKQRGTLPWEEALAITTDIAHALQYAHEKGMIHRDVKPGNIIVGPNGAVLTDFGLAKSLEGSVIYSQSVGGMVGTYWYMATEIVNGKTATPASDQFSLACTLVEMLTGRSPFQADTPIAVIEKHVSGFELPNQWPDGCPKNICKFINQSISKVPAERFANVSAFVRALEEMPENFIPQPAVIRAHPPEKQSISNMIISDNSLYPQTSLRPSFMQPDVAQKKPRVIIGTIGHLFHGKTTLTSAITKVQSLRGLGEFREFESLFVSPEERDRLITINTKILHYETENRRQMLIDMPGHRDYIVNMIRGVSQVDGVILVISSKDGIMPQTREHILLARQMEVREFVVFVNQFDSVGDSRPLSIIENQIKDFLRGYGLSDDVPIVFGNALKSLESRSSNPNAREYRCVNQLLDAIDKHVSTYEGDVNQPFMMPVGDVLELEKDINGVVVTGRVLRGRINVGDPVEIVGLQLDKQKSVVTEIEISHEMVDKAFPGETIGMLLRGINRNNVSIGMVVAKPGSILQHDKFECETYLLTTQEGGQSDLILPGYEPVFYFRNFSIQGKVTMGEDVKYVLPGERARLKVELFVPLVLELGTSFPMRKDGHTVGVGVITKFIK